MDIEKVIKYCEKKAELYKELGFDANVTANASTPYGKKCYEESERFTTIAELLKQLQGVQQVADQFLKEGETAVFEPEPNSDSEYLKRIIDILYPDNPYKKTCSNCGWCQTSDDPEEEDTLVCANGECENCGRVLGTLETGPIDIEDCGGFEEPL